MKTLQNSNVWKSEISYSKLVLFSLQVILKGLENYTSLLKNLYITNL